MGIKVSPELEAKILVMSGVEVHTKPAKGKPKPVPLVRPHCESGDGWLAVTVPVRLDGAANDHRGKQAQIGRAASQRPAIADGLAGCMKSLAPFVERVRAGLPVAIAVTRLAPGELDRHDNLPMACKWLVDTVALFCGVADRALDVRYRQIRSAAYGATIEFSHDPVPATEPDVGAKRCDHCGGPVKKRANESPRNFMQKRFCGRTCRDESQRAKAVPGA